MYKKINKLLPNFIKSSEWYNLYYQRKFDSELKKRLLKENGCYVKCKKCDKVIEKFEKDYKDGSYGYWCNDCKIESIFHYDIAPCPILMKDSE